MVLYGTVWVWYRMAQYGYDTVLSCPIYADTDICKICSRPFDSTFVSMYGTVLYLYRARSRTSRETLFRLRNRRKSKLKGPSQATFSSPSPSPQGTSRKAFLGVLLSIDALAPSLGFLDACTPLLFHAQALGLSRSLLGMW
jgi:hypothetical protein